MRHNFKRNKINLNCDHRKSLLRNLSKDLIKHGKIKTTLARCRAIRPIVEKLVTKSKIDNVAQRRVVYNKVGDRDIVYKLFNDFGPRYKDRSGGYLRIYKIADGRFGDNAKMGIVEFV